MKERPVTIYPAISVAELLRLVEEQRCYGPRAMKQFDAVESARTNQHGKPSK